MNAKRSIFEDVDASKTEAKADAAKPQAGQSEGARRGIAIWLGILFAMVVVMIIVGGLTRLTDSGLSITEWRPVTGAIPPLSAEAWDREFAKYQEIPEFQLQNSNMTMAEFKVIYWWEWGHRQLGRAIGLVWALGFFWFLVRRSIPTGWMPRLLGLGALGGLQGFIGWWMVSSGLSGRVVDVASYRLAIHLGLAFVILGLIAWFILQLRRSEAELLQARRRREAGYGGISAILLGLTFLQLLLGALVAGLDAGRGYVDWPLMGGEVFPSDAFIHAPAWTNFFESEALTQFNHRLVGYGLLAFAVFAWVRARASALVAVRTAFLWCLGLMVFQAIWGIITVMNAAPLWLAIIHQAGAIAVWVFVLRARFTVLYPATQSLR